MQRRDAAIAPALEGLTRLRRLVLAPAQFVTGQVEVNPDSRAGGMEAG